jgi:prepilin-type N-terminal cleavage/methylation domain-containing protein
MEGKTNYGRRRAASGFSLAEVLISLALFGLMSTAFLAACLFARKSAECAVYESTALTAATGYLEQIKSLSYSTVLTSINDPDQPIPTMVNQGTQDYLYLDVYTEKVIAVRLDTDGSALQQMSLFVMPVINDEFASTGQYILNIAVHYRWTEPGTGRVRNACIRTARSNVPTI